MTGRAALTLDEIRTSLDIASMIVNDMSLEPRVRDKQLENVCDTLREQAPNIRSRERFKQWFMGSIDDPGMFLYENAAQNALVILCGGHAVIPPGRTG